MIYVKFRLDHVFSNQEIVQPHKFVFVFACGALHFDNNDFGNLALEGGF